MTVVSGGICMRERFTVADFLIYSFFIIFLLLILVPLWSIVVVSLSTPEGYAQSKFHLWSNGFTLEAYKRALGNTGGILNGLWVSMQVTTYGTITAMILTCLAGYVLSKKTLPGRGFLFVFVLSALFFNGGLMPFFITVRNYGLADSLMAMFIPTAISTYYVILMKNYFESLPSSLEEAAKLDGCNDIQILFRIVIPMSTPAFAAISLFYAIFFWNEYFYATLFISINKLYPLPVLLRQMIVQNLAMAQIGVQTMATNAEQFKMACLVIAIFPIVAVFPFIQKYFAKGLNMGAIKG